MVYSTPDETGWYCIPEVGDSIRLYAPNEHDEQVYVASAVYLPLVSGPERSNPDFKSIMNKQRKEVLFTPETLLITNNNGMSIELSDQEGIKIVSDKAIMIQSDASVDITSTTSTINVTVPERLTFRQDGTAIPIRSISGVGGGFEIMSEYKIDKKVFSTADLSAILMGLSSLSNMVRGDELVNALAKVKSFIPAEKVKDINQKTNQICIDLSPWMGNQNIQPYFRND